MSAAAADRSLFASKGRATAVGVDPTTQPAAATDDGPAAIQPADGATDPHGAGPAGSLLNFRLRNPSRMAALVDKPRMDVAETADISDAAHASATPSPAATLPAEVAAVASPSAIPPVEIEIAPAASSNETEPPHPVRLDRPLYPRARLERDAELATRPAALPIATPRTSAWRIALPIGAAVVAIAAVGWLISRTQPLAPAEPVATSEPATAVFAEAAPGPARPAEPLAPSMTEAAPETPAGSPVAAPASPEPVAMAHPDLPAPVVAAPAPMAPLPPDAPTFEVVRVAPDAPPVLAGRAAPGSHLIVLDNGDVIGTVTANANGEWALVTDMPLPAGRHELTLALVTPDGAVVVEQADTQAGAPPAAGEGLPVPGEKPVTGGTAASPGAQLYVVQLASVPSAADAEREWARLQRAYPAELGTASVDIGAVEIGERGTFYRLRTGSFADRDEARRLCAALNIAGQECLVVRQAAE